MDLVLPSRPAATDPAATTTDRSGSRESDAGTGPLGVTTAGETVRPEPGTLARGLWEAPVWTFYAAIAAVVVGALLYSVGSIRRAMRARGAGLFRRRGPRA